MNENPELGDTEYAGFWIRVAASLVDIVWQIVVFGAIAWAIYGDALLDTLVSWVVSEEPLAGELPMMLYQNLLPALVIVPFWFFFGATPGKMLLGLKIVRASDSSKIGIGRSILRFLAYIPATVILGIGFIWAAFDKRKQGLHDKIAGTVVIKTRISS
ncbi:MAG: RDD family protein [Granulosicoccaceae bacterium]